MVNLVPHSFFIFFLLFQQSTLQYIFKLAFLFGGSSVLLKKQLKSSFASPVCMHIFAVMVKNQLR